MGIWLEYLPELHHQPYRLGRHVEHDEENFKFAWSGEKATGNSVVWGSEGPILNQLSVGACTGFTDADVLNTDMFAAIRKKKHGGTYLQAGDALDFYHEATELSALGGGQVWPPDDPGSSGPAAAQAAVNAGYFDTYTHCFTWDQFQSAIEKQPVMLGTIWTNDMFNYNGDGVVSIGSLDDNNIAGGHEYMARGILYQQSLVLCRNHWYAQDNVTPWNEGTDGLKQPGEFYISFQDLQTLLNNQGDVTVPS